MNLNFKKTMEEGLAKQKYIACFWIERLPINVSSLSKFINSKMFKIKMAFLLKFDKLILKFVWKSYSTESFVRFFLDK